MAGVSVWAAAGTGAEYSGKWKYNRRGMLIAALDTTTSRGSVALWREGDVVAELRLRSEASHSTQLLPGLESLLRALGAGPDAVDGYAVTTGPGSFTGLRVGLATVQGLALARSRPCVGLSALDVLAVRIRGAAVCLVSVMDAFRGELYYRVYDGEGRPLGEPGLASPEAIAGSLDGEVAFAGDGLAAQGGALRGLLPGAVFPERSLFLAGTLARLAGPMLERAEGTPASALRPLYIRPPTIRKAGG
jgi:tRNA threonylcarbamoyladenosine biosynthesis protein TsaB